MTKINKPVPRKSLLSPRYLASKIWEKGLVWCFKTFLQMVYSMVHRPIVFFMNVLIFHSTRKPKNVILGVWDYKTIPWSVGDFLVFIETLNVLKLSHGADRVDICVVCDSKKPAGNRGYANINSSNYRYYLFNLLPIVSTCPYLGSVFQFHSRSEFYSFLKLNINRYEIYPSIKEQLRETFNFYGGATLREIRAFYRKHGFIPHLTIGDYHLRWACNLYQTEAKGKVPVAVSLRYRPDSPHRNADREAWLGFFDLCKSEFPEVVFVVTGVREEVFEELRNHSNVIVAKDHGSTLSDDFALVRTSLLYMGMDTGLGSIAYFTGVPCLLFGIPPKTKKQLGLDDGSNLEFLTQYQKIFFSSFLVSSLSLLGEFANLYGQLDADEWRKRTSVHKGTVRSFATWERR